MSGGDSSGESVALRDPPANPSPVPHATRTMRKLPIKPLARGVTLTEPDSFQSLISRIPATQWPGHSTTHHRQNPRPPHGLSSGSHGSSNATPQGRQRQWWVSSGLLPWSTSAQIHIVRNTGPLSKLQRAFLIIWTVVAVGLAAIIIATRDESGGFGDLVIGVAILLLVLALATVVLTWAVIRFLVPNQTARTVIAMFGPPALMAVVPWFIGTF